ncbi:hypothetical protein SAMN06295912_11137 [Sphingomonas laterariae]|uniref:Uncharacterized protein n=1 Tax=Edaphosphingomonas laterariae TaxID=861865 RepID=A0A239G516_9SPHN|nr:hypothetical protein [Sphingomonas laterariae]SNS64257.1 hypothetical protein SAMN06295912_11137 [Sphingomonas laterariae]
MRRQIALGLLLLAVPILAIAQNAPAPPDRPGPDQPGPDQPGNTADNPLSNSNWGNSAEPVPAADDPLINNMIDGERPESPQRSAAPR